MSKMVIAWLALMLIVLGGTGIVLAVKYRREHSLAAGSAQPEVDLEYRRIPKSGDEKWLTEFTLTERSGQRVGTQELAGKIQIVSFFFSTCPTSCMQQNRKFSELHQAYGRKGVQFVSITCDPETDSPAVLREYASRHFPQAGKTWWFLTGDLNYVQRVAGEIFMVYLERQQHMEDFLVIDKWGNYRGKFHWNRDEELTDLRRLLDKLVVEKAPPADLPPQPTRPASGEGGSEPQEGHAAADQT
jgi:cytochrome oxidase Cu insertion factor (SCO1/SenC/PrrC family)